MHVNLFSESLQRRVLVDRRAAQWMKVWGVAFIVAVAVGVREWPQARSVRADLNLAETRSAPVVEKLAERDRLKSELANIVEARTKLRRLAPDTIPLGVLGLISEATRSTENAVQIISVDYVAAKHSAAAAKNGSPAQHGTITVHGLAADEAAAARFVEHLRRSSCLRHVELKASSRATTSVPAIQFDVVSEL